MDLLFTAGMLGLMAVAIVILGRTWPRSSRSGGYRAGRGKGVAGAGEASASDVPEPPAPQEEDAPWRWQDGAGDGGPPAAGDDGPTDEALRR